MIVEQDSAANREYQLLMEIRGREVTGICIVNAEDANHMVGTLVNEFGVKAFDFTYANGKAKVLNVVGPLNKWYIKKVLKRDFRFILPNLWRGKDVVEKKRRLTVMPNGDIIIRNDRFKIVYTFTPITEKE